MRAAASGGPAILKGRVGELGSAGRIARAFGYLRPSAVVGALMPLSLGYVARTRAYGVPERARSYGGSNLAPVRA